MKLPAADLYVCTGDMLPNFPKRNRDPGTYDQPCDLGGDWQIVPERERKMQGEWMREFQREGGFSRFLGTPDAPMVCVRGNHDFTDIAPLFFDCNLVHEFRLNEVIELMGLRVTGHRGIPYIYGGWSDEVQRPELLERAKAMEEADLYLTHYPPAGILDFKYGLDGLASTLGDKMRDGRPLVHCFGHIHECGGSQRQLGDALFSNAACTFNELSMLPTCSS